MRLVIILIPILLLLIILPLILGEHLIKPADVSPPSCINCHRLDEIGIVTTEGIPISNKYEWQSYLHKYLDNPDCLECHITNDNPLIFFRHELLIASIRSDCNLCHIDSMPDDTLHSSISYTCGICHSTQKWSGALFEHDQFFRFDNNHPSTCENCHLVAGDFSQYSCYGECHGHTEVKISKEHLEEGISDFEDCAECHNSGNEH